MLSMQQKMDNELYKMENLHLSCQSDFFYNPSLDEDVLFLVGGWTNPIWKILQ